MSDHRRPFVHRRQVQFVETDMAGIVHFSNLFRLMEEAEHAFLKSLGLSLFMDHEGRTLSLPRLHAKADFLSPARFEDWLEIAVVVKKLGKKSVTFGYSITTDGRAVLEGEVVAVCCVMQPGGKITSIPIPPDCADKLRTAIV